jgi:hypothetical protein
MRKSLEAELPATPTIKWHETSMGRYAQMEYRHIPDMYLVILHISFVSIYAWDYCR